MTFVSNALAVALASATVAWTGLIFASSADAEPAKTFQVAFKYSAAHPAEAIYASIQDQAVEACMREAGPLRRGPLVSQVRWMKTCREDLVSQAVAAIGKPELIALHKNGAPGSQVAGR